MNSNGWSAWSGINVGIPMEAACVRESTRVQQSAESNNCSANQRMMGIG